MDNTEETYGQQRLRNSPLQATLEAMRVKIITKKDLEVCPPGLEFKYFEITEVEEIKD